MKVSILFSELLHLLIYFCTQTIMKNIYILPKVSRKTLGIMKIQYLACLFLMKMQNSGHLERMQRKSTLFAKQLKTLRKGSGHYLFS